MLPFLESILSQFLKNPEQQASALEGAKIDGEGVLVSRLLSNLKRLIQNLEDNGKSIPDGQSRQQIAQLMRDLGMRSDQEIVTLERFIQELETLAAKASETAGSRQIQIASLNRFIANLHNVNNQYGNTEKWQLSGKTQTAVLTDTKAMAPGRVNVDANAFLSKEASMGTVKSLDNMKQGVDPSTGTESLTNMPERLVTPEQKSPVRTLPAYVMNQVGRQILRSLQRGNPEIWLQLKPPHLGRLQMRIDGSGDGMRVHIVTEHRGTQEMLLSHANELKSALAEQGVKLVKVDIQFDQSFEQSMAHSGQDSEKMFHRRRKKSGFVLGGELEADIEDKPVNVRADEGVLDLVA
jgi:flagellar hook-length control protein FliK